MNKQDAIQILQDDVKRHSKKEFPENTESLGLKAVIRHRKEKVEAYQMAISALEHQLANEAEIEKLHDENASIRNWNACEAEEYARLLESDKRRIELETENEALHQLTNGWIPVSEQLPCENECYRIFATIKCKETGYLSSVRMRWFFGRFKWMNGSLLSPKFEVVAWMFDDTPEPYMEAVK